MPKSQPQFARSRAAATISLAVVALAFISLSFRGELLVSADSISYRDFQFASIAEILGSSRTPVYPLFLKSVEWLGVHDQGISWLQAAIFLCTFLYCWSGFLRSGWSEIQLFLLALPFLLSGVLLRYSELLLPETIAAACSFSATVLIAQRLNSHQKRLREVLIGIFILLAVLLKPQYLALIPLSLCSLLILWRCQPQVQLKSTLRFTGNATFLTCGPLLSYCLLRLFVVGHFGLVSFGGAAIAGFALNPLMFDESIVESIADEELQEAGRAVLLRRQDLLQQAAEVPDLRTQDPNVRVADVLDASRLHKRSVFEAFQACFNSATYDVARDGLKLFLGLPVAARDDIENVRINDLMSRLSRHSLKQRPQLYLKWMASAVRHCFELGIRYETWAARLITLQTGLLILVLALWLGVFLYTRSRDFALQRNLTLLALAISGSLLASKLLGLILGLWAWVPGTVAPVLLPAVVMTYGLLVYLARLFVGAGKAGLQQMEYLLMVFSLWCFGKTLLICLVEPPLERYLMTVRPVLAAECAVILWWATRQVVTAMHFRLLQLNSE